jgi:hypothetical protein
MGRVTMSTKAFEVSSLPTIGFPFVDVSASPLSPARLSLAQAAG